MKVTRKTFANKISFHWQNVRVGTNPNALLEEPQEHNVEPSCDVTDPCDSFPCPDNSYCNNEWEKYSCTCQPGLCYLFALLYIQTSTKPIQSAEEYNEL